MVCPALLVAVTVYVVAVLRAVGIPLIAPEFGSKNRPAGRAGVIEKVIGVVPATVAASVVIRTLMK